MHFPLRLRLTPSLTLLGVGALAHLGIFAACLIGVPSVWLKGACGFLIAGSFIRLIADERRKSGRSLTLDDAGLVAFDGESPPRPGMPIKSATDFRWVVWLTWQELGDAARGVQTHNLMLLPDHLPKGEWRLLRIWLRHKASFVSGDAADVP